MQADAWYAEAVGWAASSKVVTGYADGTFRPNAAVTREQAAAILYRYAQKRVSTKAWVRIPIFSAMWMFSGQVSTRFRLCSGAVGAGVLNGKNGGRLAPTGTATRCRDRSDHAALVRKHHQVTADKTAGQKGLTRRVSPFCWLNNGEWKMENGKLT